MQERCKYCLKWCDGYCHADDYWKDNNKLTERERYCNTAIGRTMKMKEQQLRSKTYTKNINHNFNNNGKKR